MNDSEYINEPVEMPMDRQPSKRPKIERVFRRPVLKFVDLFAGIGGIRLALGPFLFPTSYFRQSRSRYASA